MTTINWHIAIIIAIIFLLVAICLVFHFIYKILIEKSNEKQVKILPLLPKRDYTLSELKSFNGKGEDGRICVATMGKVYDVTRCET